MLYQIGKSISNENSAGNDTLAEEINAVIKYKPQILQKRK